MFSTHVLTSNILRGVHQYSKLAIRNVGAIRHSATSCNRNLLVNIKQPKTNAILRRFCANGPTRAEPAVKSKKIVGYWLLGCSGMVFTAVVLGGALVYFVLLLSILDKYLVHTTK